MRYKFYISLVAALWGLPTIASRVIEVEASQERVAISHPYGEEWPAGHTLCIMKKEKIVACGWVAESTEHEAWLKILSHDFDIKGPKVWDDKLGEYVQLKFHREQIKIGQRVVAKKLLRDPSSQTTNTDFEEKVEIRKDYDAILEKHVSPVNAITAGLDLAFPYVHFQHALTNNFATGLSGMFIQYPANDGEIQGLGAQLTFNWYGDAPYTGMFWKFALGVFDMDAIVNGNYSGFLGATASLNVGYKWRWKSGVNFGLGFGARYLLALSEPSGYQVPNIIPSIAMDFGFAF